MGAEPLPANTNTNIHHSNGGEAPLVVGLQPSALIDHVARVDWSLLNQIPGERGGSIPRTSFTASGIREYRPLLCQRGRSYRAVKGEKTINAEVTLEFLAKHCNWAVVTLAANGCIAKHGKEVARVPAIGEWESKALDATGAGDLFASGFLYGLVKVITQECCKVGSCSGGSVIRSLGGEVTLENLHWMHKQMQIKSLPIPGTRSS